MMFDTDMLIWAQRGNLVAADLIDAASERNISIVTYMELLQNARDKVQHRNTKQVLSELGFVVLPLTENIGHRAAYYIEQYALSHGFELADALIAATAIENCQVLVTSNIKHFRIISDLQVKTFKP